MSLVVEVLQEELDDLVKDLQKRHQQLGMKATSNWLRQLETEVYQVGTRYVGKVLGTFYTYFLVNGRKPGKRPPSKVIEKWIRVKGITPKGDITVKQLAFLIARKIGEFGTKYYRQGGTDLISSVVTPARIESIINKVVRAYEEETIPALQENLKSEFASL
tara:strand:- start:43 stop:525 length:483 start_codon:yes stop_codon:yes gene_type:complete